VGAKRLGLPYRWIDIDVVKGEAKTPEFLSVNPAGQVPAVVLNDGRVFSPSNAIMLHLAEGSDLSVSRTYGEGADIEDLARDMALIEFPAFPNLPKLHGDAPADDAQRV
jgi:glutathione S-transferase